MRISVIRSGGFAGIERRAALDTTGRPDAFHLHALARDTLAAGEAAPPRGFPTASSTRSPWTAGPCTARTRTSRRRSGSWYGQS